MTINSTSLWMWKDWKVSDGLFTTEQLLGGERRPSSLDGQPVVAIADFWLPQRYGLTSAKRARKYEFGTERLEQHQCLRLRLRARATSSKCRAFSSRYRPWSVSGETQLDESLSRTPNL
jgi:hypothetical protein